MSKETTHRDRPVRLALVGLGGHGGTIQQAAALADAVEVVAVFDRVAAERQAAAARFGCEEAASYETLLDRDDLEAVVLVTPNALHRPQAEAAFAAGLDVFVEKPIANTVADGLVMVEAAEAAGRILMVGHNMRFGRATQAARRVIAAGRLGEVVSFDVHFSADNARRLPPDAWRLHPDQCPLLPVMQLGIHAIDLVHYLLGPVETVYALARSVTTAPGVIDSVGATLRLATGPVGTLVSNYCTPVFFHYCIAGTEGWLRCTPHQYRFQTASEADGEGEGPVETGDYRAYDLERSSLMLNAFAASVRRRARPEIDGWVGLQALAVVEALRRSSENETPERVPIVRPNEMKTDPNRL